MSSIENPQSKLEVLFIGDNNLIKHPVDRDLFAENAENDLMHKIISAMKLTQEFAVLSPNDVEFFTAIEDKSRNSSPLIVSFGKLTTQKLLMIGNSIEVIGQWQLINIKGKNYRVLPTYHPRDILRFPAYKREVWQHMKLVMSELRD